MADLNDLNIKRTELNTAIATYTQAVQDYAAGSATLTDVNNAKTAAQVKGDELAKLIQQVKKDDPNVTSDDDLFSNPGRMNALVRDDIAGIMTTGQFLGGAMKLLVDTEGDAAGATNVILTFDAGSNIEVDWGDGSAKQTFTGAASHDYATPGQYEVKVTGTVNGFTAAGVGYRRQLKDVMQWGSVEFASIMRMFAYREGFTISASDKPTLLPGCSFFQLFINATDFNSNISHWDVSNVVDMRYAFANALAFNGDISSWNVANVTNMQYMFWLTTSFNQPLNTWDVSNVVYMDQMFRDTGAFNQPLNNWNTISVVRMDRMFQDSLSFNQDISMWNVANVTSATDFRLGSSLAPANSPNFT